LQLQRLHFQHLPVLSFKNLKMPSNTAKAPFDAKSAQESAHIVATMSSLPWPAFTPDTEALKSRAKPEIWKESAKFKEASEKMMGEAAKLEIAAKSGNLDNIKAAFGAVGGSCKACHDSFQAKLN
jgi:cytochrome c556